MKIHIPSALGIFSTFNFSYSNSMLWYLSVALVYISLVAKDVEYLLMCFIAIYISILVKCLLNFITYLLIFISFSFVRYVIFKCLLVCYRCISFINRFCRAKVLFLMKSNLWIFFLYALSFW